jgi:hypothetical protein
MDTRQLQRLSIIPFNLNKYRDRQPIQAVELRPSGDIRQPATTRLRSASHIGLHLKPHGERELKHLSLDSRRQDRLAGTRVIFLVWTKHAFAPDYPIRHVGLHP